MRRQRRDLGVAGAAMNAPVKPSRELCIMACAFCRDPLFWEWLNHAGIECKNSDDAKASVLDLSGDIGSRGQLDTDPAAAKRFHVMVRSPFVFWKQERRPSTDTTDWSAA
jgi:hypothetical protein